MKKVSAYTKAGVNIHSADRFVGAISAFVKSTQNQKVTRVPSGYAGLYQLSANQYIAATTDGVGTKLKLAVALGQHKTIGIDLVAMSVNDLICVGATPLFFLDYYATGKLNVSVAKSVVEGITRGCSQSGIALIGGETAEMPGVYSGADYDLAGFAVGLVSKNELITGAAVKPGDSLVALESSGPHSNGYSLVRKLFSASEKKWYKLCLKPTQIYVREFLKLRSKLGKDLKGAAHITGGGFLNIPRISEKVDYFIQLPKSFKIPKVFLEMKNRGHLSWSDLFTTFNMGIGMVLVVPEKKLKTTLQFFESTKIKAHHIGQTTKATSKAKTWVKVRGSSPSESIKFDLKY